jgi:hypothetical protein
MEDGTILLVGATTENPSFELNAALLSRAQVLVLERLSLADLERLAQRAEPSWAARCRSTARGARGAAGDGRWRRARAAEPDRTGRGLEDDPLDLTARWPAADAAPRRNTTSRGTRITT